MNRASGEPVVTLAGVNKHFGSDVHVLSDVSFAVQQAEFVSILGPSGCGKSTILRLAAGLEAPSTGTVQAPALNTSIRGATAFVFQEPTLMPWTSVFNNVWLPLRLQGVSKEQARSRIEAALRGVRLEDFAQAYPAQLSGGMKMRASIARALITEPKILLMDEPFAALDDISRQRLNNDLLRWQQERGIATLFVTHNIAEAVFLSRRVLVMGAKPGRITYELTIDEPYPRLSAFRNSDHFILYCRTLSRALMKNNEPDGAAT